MKSPLLILFSLIFFNISFAQYNPATITLNSGKTINDVHLKIQNFSIKYKGDLKGKPKKIDFSEIESFEIFISPDSTKTYSVFQENRKDKYIAVQELVRGKKAVLYGEALPAVGKGVGGTPLGYEFFRYYVKGVSDEKLTFIGNYNPLLNGYKNNILDFFYDCKDLVTKINEREIKLIEIEKMVHYYNEDCKSI